MMLFLALFFVWIPTFVVPPTHKYLRNNTVYICCIIVAISIFGWSLENYSPNLPQIEKSHMPLYISPLVFLILYKLFDNIIQKRLERHMYFRMKYMSNKESEEQTWFEWLLQMVLGFVPLICGAIWLLIF
ncbi:hypothetical protein TH63_09810 [Rufibacter radiotolerans]|uniref:Uncharacterized protein n=1 Tax=Rufibacter radiotolerans TaxID=1379910 RepID=A0A0H4W607_9BACT|nr:hypothetical protein TH63_09810 [Rufibacter radiotolerans]